MKRKILVICIPEAQFGMIKNPETKALEPFEFKDVYIHLPMLKLIDANVDFHRTQTFDRFIRHQSCLLDSSCKRIFKN